MIVKVIAVLSSRFVPHEVVYESRGAVAHGVRGIGRGCPHDFAPSGCNKKLAITNPLGEYSVFIKTRVDIGALP